MIGSILADFVTWLLTSAVGALAGWAARSVRDRHRSVTMRDDAMLEGIRSLLRGELIRSYEAYVVRGEPMDVNAAEYVQRTYDSYHRLGGNDVGTHLYEEISARRIRG